MSRCECACAGCVAACKRRPGWLTPRDVVRLAAHVGLEPPRLFDEYLAWDFWFSMDGDVLVPIPATALARAGTHLAWGDAFKPSRCQQLTPDDRCAIHPVKPRECAEAFHGQGPERLHELIARAWTRPAARRFRDQLRVPRETC